MGPALEQLGEDNYRVYGDRKLWTAARRARSRRRPRPGRPVDAARRHRRGPPGKAGAHHESRSRYATASGSGQTQLHRDRTQSSVGADLTYVPTWCGVGYVCFITDVYSRMIVGWRVASHMSCRHVGRDRRSGAPPRQPGGGTRLSGPSCSRASGRSHRRVRYPRVAHRPSSPS
ncbi:transposase [Gordonia neofelifaecis NRRL B-59395]|uniref:Transposase n=1 Tax=Gordonia neofelifaecis NRRL B-59395 TaxID=644548 RepID=F1YGJ0_9ACTN|nr:transposase [Gordonia neofelifaecis NRRL B-59395]